MKQIPYFLLFNYPKKMNAYIKAQKANKNLLDSEKVKLNAYHSCSPMNELCEYICRWEKQRLIWDKSVMNTGVLLVDSSMDLSSREILSAMKKINNEFSIEWREWLFMKDNDENVDLNIVLNKYKEKLYTFSSDINFVANYFIKACYESVNTNKALCWYAFGDIIIENLRKNSPPEKSISINEVTKYTDGAFEFLGKYYKMSEEGK